MGLDVQPLDREPTVATEAYDCTAAPEWFRKAVKNSARWAQGVTAAVGKLSDVLGE
jgi:hypothetical protein